MKKGFWVVFIRGLFKGGGFWSRELNEGRGGVGLWW